ncbi:MAG TPA: metallophosphoesterase [Candidatus Limnocylindrales bacterium]
MRRFSIEWPDPTPFRGRDGAPIRILAVSDLLEPSLTDARNRAAISPVDFIIGCGDMDCNELAFVTDAINAPILYVHGNHDTEASWQRNASFCPEALHSTSVVHQSGLSLAGLTWPGQRGKGGNRSERLAWSQAMRLATRRLGHIEPLIVLSHVPPLGVGDVLTDAYHRGFKGYRWLLERLEPTLWLHGHTPLAATSDWMLTVGGTTVMNVTGAVVIDLLPPTPETLATRHRRLKVLASRQKAEPPRGTPGGL